MWRTSLISQNSFTKPELQKPIRDGDNNATGSATFILTPGRIKYCYSEINGYIYQLKYALKPTQSCRENWCMIFLYLPFVLRSLIHKDLFQQ